VTGSDTTVTKHRIISSRDICLLEWGLCKHHRIWSLCMERKVFVVIDYAS